MKEALRRKWLSKEISDVIVRTNKRHTYLAKLNCLTNEEMPALNMLSALVVFRARPGQPSLKTVETGETDETVQTEIAQTLT